jgi:hypothetical protein
LFVSIARNTIPLPALLLDNETKQESAAVADPESTGYGLRFVHPMPSRMNSIRKAPPLGFFRFAMRQSVKSFHVRCNREACEIPDLGLQQSKPRKESVFGKPLPQDVSRD